MVSDIKSKPVRVGQVFIHILFIFACLTVLFPVILTLIVSFSSEMSVINYGYTFFPKEWSVDAYKTVFADNDILQAYMVTIFVTVVGTLVSIFVCSLAAYGMSNPKVKHRNKFALYFYLPTIISAGVVAWYFNIAYTLGLKNSIWVLILPNIVSVYNIFLIRNYYKTIPPSLAESAEIDGAGPYITFFVIIIPLSLPIIATVTLFVALGYWNDWYLATWFIDYKHTELFPLQYYMQMLWVKMSNPNNTSSDAPVETVYVATMFVTMGPIVLVYPFIQKYFIKGIIVGAVKG